MRRLFDYDGQFMGVANRIANLMWLGVLTLLFSFPVVSAGASLTAMYYTIFQMREKDRDDVLRCFWHGFTSNFLQSTILWIAILAGCYLLYGNIVLLAQALDTLSILYTSIIGLLLVAAYAFLIPMQARYANTWVKILRNSFVMGILHLPKAILAVVLHIVPFVLSIFYPAIFPVVLVLGLSVPAYLNAPMLLRIFDASTSTKQDNGATPDQMGGDAEP